MRVIELSKDTNTNITIFLLKNIKNIKFLKQEVVSGKIDCCGIKPSLIVDIFQIVVAANKAACSKKGGTLRTRTLNTELLFNLSVSKNISKALHKFSLDKDDKDAIIVIFEENGEKKFEGLKGRFEGDICEVGDLSETADVSLIRKLYRIPDKELEVSHLLDSVVSRISTKELGLII